MGQAMDIQNTLALQLEYAESSVAEEFPNHLLENRSSTSADSEINDCFFPQMQVSDPEGTSLSLQALGGGRVPLTAHYQEELFTVAAGYDTLLHLLVSETGMHCGILMESAQKIPIAYIDTTNAALPHANEIRSRKRSNPYVPPPVRYASICRTDDLNLDPYYVAPYAIVRAMVGHTHQFKVRRVYSDGSSGRLMFVVTLSRARGICIIDPTGRIVAQQRIAKPGDSTAKKGAYVYPFHFAWGADTGLLICVAVAVLKLRTPHGDEPGDVEDDTGGDALHQAADHRAHVHRAHTR